MSLRGDPPRPLAKQPKLTLPLPAPPVPPADLEALLLTHPEIDDCGVIGVMSEEQATELPRAYVVPRGGLAKWSSGVERKRLEEEIVGWVAKSVSVGQGARGGVRG